MWFKFIGVLLLLRPHMIRPFSSHRDFYRYRSVNRRKFKEIKNYKDCVEDHHIIPKQWKNHELLQTLKFDVNHSQNLYIMPKYNAKQRFYLHPDTLFHEGGHKSYNKYVKTQLDYVYSLNNDRQKYEFWLLLHHLKANIRDNRDNIPWK